MYVEITSYWKRPRDEKKNNKKLRKQIYVCFD